MDNSVRKLMDTVKMDVRQIINNRCVRYLKQCSLNLKNSSKRFDVYTIICRFVYVSIYVMLCIFKAINNFNKYCKIIPSKLRRYVFYYFLNYAYNINLLVSILTNRLTISVCKRTLKNDFLHIYNYSITCNFILRLYYSEKTI